MRLHARYPIFHISDTELYSLRVAVNPKVNAGRRRSKTIQNLPPALFTLMKSTEPHSDLYYQMDIEAALRDAGFQHVVTKEADHRHRAVLGLAPQR